MTKKTHYIVNYKITDGKNEYLDHFLIITKPEMLLSDCEDFFKNFFGAETKRGDDSYTDGDRSLKIGRCRELTKEDFKILEKYLRK